MIKLEVITRSDKSSAVDLDLGGLLIFLDYNTIVIF